MARTHGYDVTVTWTGDRGSGTSGVVVTGYHDAARGTMTEGPDGGGRFAEVVLRPRVIEVAAR